MTDAPEVSSVTASAPATAPQVITAFFDSLNEQQIDSVVHYLGMAASRQRVGAPSHASLPLTPPPLWQRITVSALRHRESLLNEQRAGQRQRGRMSKQLVHYHTEYRQREEQRRRQQREDRARVGSRVTLALDRFWKRVGERYTQVQRVAFVAVKQALDKHKQEDLLRETEELTKKLLSSILVSYNTAAVDPTGGSSASAAEVELESTLSLLDTQNGKRPLRHYQKSALHWMIHLFGNRLNGILADEMGLGKTVQTIALLCYYAEYKNDWGPHLVVVPATVVLNWKAELERWAPGLKVITYVGSAKERQALRRGWSSEDAFHVCVTSYNLIVQDRAVFRRRPWGFLVLDEAHQVKNFMSKRWQSLFDLQAEYRLLLTGTPLQNSIMELWSLFHFLLPFASAFRSNEEFKEWFSNPMDDMVSGRAALNEEIVRRLQALLRPFMLRRLKKDVESQLPSKQERVVMCTLSRRQRGLYDDYMQLAATKQRLMGGGVGGVLTVLLALRKVCNHPDLFEERPTVSPLCLSYDEVLRLPVPRTVLLLNNFYRYRFPRPTALSLERAFVDDLYLPAADDVTDWEPRSSPNCALKQLGGALDAFPSSYLVLGIDTNPHDNTSPVLRQLQPHSYTVAASTSLNNSSISSVVSPLFRAAATTLVSSYHSRWETTRRIQQQRYQQAECVLRLPLLRTVTSVHATLRDTQLKRRFPELVPPVASRVAALSPLMSKFLFYVPKAVPQRPPELCCRFPVSHMRPFRCPTRRDLAEGLGEWMRAATSRVPHLIPETVFDASSVANELWPIHVRRCFSFPEKRLLIHDCGKLQFLEPALKQLRQEGHRALIFTQFVQMLNILERFLALIGVAYLRLDGSTRVDRRQEMVDRFNVDERITCMILSTRSGGIGLNLTGADTVIFYDSDWNPTMDLQAQDRCHRIGQTRPVTIYRLISAHTVEENILQKARERKKLNNVVIRGGQFHTIAGVVEDESLHGDASSAFAALAEPVNLRSFFHDLDEDATVHADAQSVSGEALLNEMEQVEDAEDREARRNMERELHDRRREEESESGGADGDVFGAVADARPQYSSEQFRRNAEMLSRYATASGDAPGAGKAGDEVEDKVARTTRKRQREVIDEAPTPLECLLTMRFGALCELTARESHATLTETFAAQFEEKENVSQLPKFRKLF